MVSVISNFTTKSTYKSKLKTLPGNALPILNTAVRRDWVLIITGKRSPFSSSDESGKGIVILRRGRFLREVRFLRGLHKS